MLEVEKKFQEVICSSEGAIPNKYKRQAVEK